MCSRLARWAFLKPNTKVSLARFVFLLILCIGSTSFRVNDTLGQSSDTSKRKAVIIKSNVNAAVVVTAVRNLDSQAWIEELEIEVKNISTKPVYYLDVDVFFPDAVVNAEGVLRKLIIPLIYGRVELMKGGHFATPGDVPIRPGDSYIFKVPEQSRKGIERHLDEGIVSDSALKRLGIKGYSLSFGDGTGFKAGGVAFSFNEKLQR
jgi:hypothetical protein